jgi:hypothetical protein
MRLLDEIAGKEEYPRNTYVCVTEEIEDLLEIQAELPQDMGSYLEEFLKNNRAKTVTLGDLLDEKANRKRNLKLPYISPQDTYVRWDGYYELKVENLEKIKD